MFLVSAFITALVVHGEAPATIIAIMSMLTVALIVKLAITPQPNPPRRGHYTAPFVPVLPCIGIIFNFYLAVQLDGLTWSYYGGFFAIGLIVYFTYGIHHSKLENTNVTRGQFEHSIVSDKSKVIGEGANEFEMQAQIEAKWEVDGAEDKKEETQPAKSEDKAIN